MDSKRYDVYGVGHALVDVQYAVDAALLSQLAIEKGVMTLIDQPRQEELARALAQAPIASCSGGSAANTMIGVAMFGGSAYYACQVGDDEWGDFYLRDLEAAGVGASPRCRIAGITGQCTVLITPDADRTLNTFLGVGSTIGPERIEEDIVADSRYVYLEGYLVGTDNGMETCRTAQRLAQAHGVPVAVTLSDPMVVDSARDRFTELAEAGIDLLFCNADEAMAYTGASGREAAALKLSKAVSRICVTCGPAGALLYEGGERFMVPGVPAQAVDTTGAGDLFAGGVLFGLTHGYSFTDAGRLGAYAAAQVVARYGSRLDSKLVDELDIILRPE